MSLNLLTDNELLALLREDDEQAFRELYNLLKTGRVVSYLVTIPPNLTASLKLLGHRYLSNYRLGLISLR